MAQTRLISELVELITPNNEDVFVIVDNTTNPSLGVTKKISYASLKEDLQDVVATLTSGGTGINASYNDLNNTLTISVVDDTTTQRTIVSSSGGEIGTRKEINFIAGTATTVSGADNSGENRVDVTIGVDASQISINDLSSASPLEVTKGGTGGSTASAARGNLGAAKAGSNSDITALTGLTTALSISQGGTGADTAQQALKGIGGLKYITDVGVGGESLVVNDTVEVANEFRGEIKGIKAGNSTISVITDGTDIAVTANPDDILGGATQNVSLNNYRLTDVASPVGATDAANRAYVDQVSAGLSIKEAVVAATTTNIASTYVGSPAFTLTVTGTGVPSFDGVNITSIGTRVLVKDQTTATQNGIYELTTAAGTGVSAVFTRTDDANSSAEVKAGIFMFVQGGTTNGNLQFTQVTNAPVLDTDPLVFSVLNDATIADNSVTNLKLSDMTALTIKGAVSSGNPQDLTPNQVLGILNSGTTKLTSNVLTSGTTAAAGIVQLYNNVNSTSSGLAATANAVKTAYDLAAGAIPISGGTFTGHVSGTTAPVGTNTTQLATTEFVNSEIANDAPTKTGGGATGTWGISISGNAGTASALASGVSIGLAGDLSGSAVFDGSSNITITGVVADDSHNHIISNVDGLQTALDAKAAVVNAALSGTPTAPTASAGTATTQIATTAFVDAAISGVTGGAVTSANKLTTARTITLSGDVNGSVSFDGSTDVTLAASVASNSVALGTDTTGNYVASAATVGSGISGSVASESGVFTVTSNATPENSLNTIVSRDANGGFEASNIDVTGLNCSNVLNATSRDAQQWTTARTLTLLGDLQGSIGFNGSTDFSLVATIGNNAVALGTNTTGNYIASAVCSGNGISGSANSEGSSFVVVSNATNSNTPQTIVYRDASGNFSANEIFANLNGVAAVATAARNLRGNGFSTDAITIDANNAPVARKDIIINNSLGSTAFAITVGKGNNEISTNSAFGVTALSSVTTGSNNVAIGYNTLSGSISGNQNVAVGSRALEQGNPSQSTAVGYQALLSSSGAFNTAIGCQAMSGSTSGGQNVAVGYKTLASNQNGSYNAAVGISCFDQNTSGNYNVGIGYFAGFSNTTGSYNTALGADTLPNNTTGNYNTAVGRTALRNCSTGSGNVTIGAATNVGTYLPAFDITTQNNRISLGSTAVTNAYIAVSWTVVSDERDKMNFGEVPHGIDFIKQLSPVSFQFKIDRDTEEPNGPVRYGFKAQDILALEGEDNAVIIDNEDPDKLRYNGEALVPVLVNAIKEQQVIIEALTARLDAAGI